MSLTEAALQEALKAVVDPNTGRDLVSTKLLRNLKIEGGDVSFEVELATPPRARCRLCAKP